MKPIMNICPAGAQKWRGVLNRTCRYIADRELKNEELWAKFVNEYRVRDDGETGAWAGEYWGKMLRGACITYGYTQDKDLYKVIVGTVKDMLTAQDNYGRFSTYTVETEYTGWDMWCRKYVLLAMEYFLDICKTRKLAKEVIKACVSHADYILGTVGPLFVDINKTSEYWGALNSNSILEPMVRLYEITGKKRYLDFADYIIAGGGCASCDIFTSALENRLFPFEYGVTKAYEMISCFEGICEYYKATGEEKYLAMAERFFDAMEKSDVTVIGCCGAEGELLNNAARLQSDPSLTDIMQENCVSVTWLKFAERLLELTGKARYADAMERTAYNAVLSAVNLPEKEHPFDSYAALLFSRRGRGRGGEKPLAAGGSYGCCECIGSAATGLMPLSAVMTDDEGCRINFYETGKAVLPFGTLEVKTKYPVSGNIIITVRSDEKFVLRLRIPGWSRRTSLQVNGEPVEAEPGWVALDRRWSDGDLVALQLDMDTYVIPAQEGRTEACSRHTAFQRGPLVLAADARCGADITRAYSPLVMDGSAVAGKCSNTAFPSMVSLEITEENGGRFTVSDYASCGKTLDRDSYMTCWFPTVDYWTLPYRRFYLLAGERYLGRGNEGRPMLSQEKTVFEADPDMAGYYRLSCGDEFLDRELGTGGEKALFRIISDLSGQWYIVCHNRFLAPDGHGKAILSSEPFRWTLEFIK
ncbi:MAG: glycoside hydrolase family 127 protein [Abditibacteriota bacterium]|nr:glycoside hydrolase family 127 protein [Abditibacteriota bacterium]